MDASHEVCRGDQLTPGEGVGRGNDDLLIAVQIGDIAKIRTDKLNTFGSHQAEYCLELEQVEQDTGRIEGFTDARSRISSKYHFRKNDVLFGRLRPYLRKFWIADRDGGMAVVPVGGQLEHARHRVRA